jgi:hypothetical protein
MIKIRERLRSMNCVMVTNGGDEGMVARALSFALHKGCPLVFDESVEEGTLAGLAPD